MPPQMPAAAQEPAPAAAEPYFVEDVIASPDDPSRWGIVTRAPGDLEDGLDDTE